MHKPSNRQSILIFLVLAGCILISVGLVAAQETATPSPTPAIPTGTPSPVELSCDPAALI